MDSAWAGLIGTAIGGIIGLLGAVVTNFFAVWKEKSQWERTQKADNDKYLREQHDRRIERLIKCYTNCVGHLATVAMLAQKSSLLIEEQRNKKDIDATVKQQIDNEIVLHIREANKWIGRLLVQRGIHDGSLEMLAINFMNDPETYADTLRNAIREKAASDPRLQMWFSQKDEQALRQDL